MRLIDADVLQEQIVRSCCKPCEAEKRDYNHVRCRACEAGDTLDWVEDAPTIDAVPVVHGRWMRDDDLLPYCSQCGERPLLDGSEEYVLSPHCPHCGARMDGDAK